MKNATLSFLQAVIVLLGITVLVLMLWEPHLEGRNADASLFEIYFKDPFLAYVYAASTLFFIALYKAFKLLGHSKQNQLHSHSSMKVIRTIQYCAIALVVLVIGAEAYLFIVQRGKDDIAGGVAMGLILILICSITAISARLLERRIQASSSNQTR